MNKQEISLTLLRINIYIYTHTHAIMSKRRGDHFPNITSIISNRHGPPQFVKNNSKKEGFTRRKRGSFLIFNYKQLILKLQ